MNLYIATDIKYQKSVEPRAITKATESGNIDHPQLLPQSTRDNGIASRDNIKFIATAAIEAFLNHLACCCWLLDLMAHIAAKIKPMATISQPRWKN